MKPKLFLLKPDFADVSAGSSDAKYYCPDCVFIEGLLSYYPQLRSELDISYVDFKRPRPAIIELIGEANQGCPVLIIDAAKSDFINDKGKIAQYLSENLGIGLMHP